MGEFGHGIISMSTKLMYDIIGLYVTITFALLAFYIGILNGVFLLTFLGFIQNCINLKRTISIWRNR